MTEGGGNMMKYAIEMARLNDERVMYAGEQVRVPIVAGLNLKSHSSRNWFYDQFFRDDWRNYCAYGEGA